MNRFTGKHTGNFIRTLILSGIFCLFVTAAFWSAFSEAARSAKAQEAANLKIAVKNDIIHCYALEGAYPESLAYIEEHYGLTYDSSRFLIDYEPVAKNIMPDVTVIDLEEKE